MARPSISTGKGDDGSTAAIAGSRVSKASARMHVLGDLDELNTILGLALAESGLPAHLSSALKKVQISLFAIGSDVATPSRHAATVPCITVATVAEIEQWALGLENTLPVLTRFILPGGSRAAGLLHHARAVCRRAERWLAALSHEETINSQVLVYLNRLSDALFLAARTANREAGVEETIV